VGDVAGLQASLDPQTLAPLAGLRILVTRTRAQASSLVDALRLEGAHPIELPAIEIERRVDAEGLATAIDGLKSSRYEWTVFTSANAVDIFLDSLMGAGKDVRALAATRLAAIGTATEAALAARGLRADLVAAESTGEGMLSAILDGMHAGERTLLPRAEGARDVLPDGLRAQGVEVDELTLYLAAPPATVPAEMIESLRAGAIDIATFTSSSTVRNLVQLLGGDVTPLRDTVIACIGPATAATARELGLEPDVVAAEHTIDGLVAALREHLLRATPEREASTSKGNA
jgi:uroporphyrinogen III methyltransferase/synthase